MGGVATAAVHGLLRRKSSRLRCCIRRCSSASIAGRRAVGLHPRIVQGDAGSTNETLFTLMMNYIATQIVAYFVLQAGRTPRARVTSESSTASATGRLASAASCGQDYLLNILIVACADRFHVHISANTASTGYELSVVGESENTARYAGINVAQGLSSAPCSSPARSAASTGFLHCRRHAIRRSRPTQPADAASPRSSSHGSPSSTPFIMMLISFLLIVP